MIAYFVKNKKLICIVLALLIALASVFAGLKYMSKAETYEKTLKTLDDKRNMVILLMTAAATASLVIAAVPSDTTTPIAEQFADLSSDFVVVLAAIFLERILLTIFGKIAFVALIPIASILFILSLVYNKKGVKILAAKFLALGIAIAVIIPGSVFISESIESKYREKFNEALNAVKIISAEEDVMEEVEEEISTELEKDLLSFSGLWRLIKSSIQNLKDKLDDAKNSIETTLNNAGRTFSELVTSCKNLAVSFVELLAIMVVTSCIIPLIVILAIYWLLKSLIAANVDFSSPVKHPSEK